MWAFLLSPVIAEQTHEGQRGFVQKRQLVQNIVDMDSHGRTLGCQALAPFIPVLFAWDFSSAFASVAHSWIVRVLKRLRLPEGVLNIVQGVSHMAHSLYAVGSTSEFFCWLLSGVLQGCPARCPGPCSCLLSNRC